MRDLLFILEVEATLTNLQYEEINYTKILTKYLL